MKNHQKSNIKEYSRRELLKGTGAFLLGSLWASAELSTACNNTNTSDTSSAIKSIESYYVINNPTGSSKVALDYLYSIEHIWVKVLLNNVVQIGVTDKFQKLLGIPDRCLLSPKGTIVNIGDSFGSLGGYKTTAELISPVSGEILEINQNLMTHSGVQRIQLDPYNNGWMLKVKLSKPEELEELLTPMYYAYLQTQDWEGPIPEMH
jgi:glycine cleavage system H protein